MKSSFMLAAAAATLAMAKPKFLNSAFDVEPGKNFELKFSGCSEGCDIVLVNGPSTGLKDVQTLFTDVKGDSQTLQLSDDFPKDTYAFKLVPSDGGDPNYSVQFEFDGNGEAPATTESSSTKEVETTTVESTSKETETSTETSTEEKTTVTKTSSEVSTTPEPTPSTTSEDEPSSTTSGGDSEESSTDVPDAAVRLGSSGVTFFAGVAAVAGYFL